MKRLVSLVTVWVVESLFVQVTLEPTGTVIEAGLKANPWIFTEEEAGVGVVVADEVGVVVEVGELTGVGGNLAGSITNQTPPIP